MNLWIGYKHFITQVHTNTHNFLTCATHYPCILYKCNAQFVIIKNCMLARVQLLNIHTVHSDYEKSTASKYNRNWNQSTAGMTRRRPHDKVYEDGKDWYFNYANLFDQTVVPHVFYVFLFSGPSWFTLLFNLRSLIFGLAHLCWLRTSGATGVRVSRRRRTKAGSHALVALYGSLRTIAL